MKPPPQHRTTAGGEPPQHRTATGRERLFTKILGDRGPWVIFESGIAASHLNWLGIAPRVAEFARVFVYDRAGLGFSLPRPEPRTAKQCVAELEELNPPTPGIFVGHSFGALIVRLFAERHPEKVRGLVLVDPVVLCEWWPATDLSRKRRTWGARITGGLAIGAHFGLINALIRLMGRKGAKVNPIVEQLVGEIEKMPAETWPVVRQHWCRSQSFVTLRRYLQSLEESCQDGARMISLGDIPLTVISGAHLNEQQREEHARIAALSTRGQHIVATQGRHWVHLDQPDLVVDAIRELCQA